MRSVGGSAGMGGTHAVHGCSRMTVDPGIPTTAETEQAGFSATYPMFLGTIAKPRGVLGVSIGEWVHPLPKAVDEVGVLANV